MGGLKLYDTSRNSDFFTFLYFPSTLLFQREKKPEQLTTQWYRTQ